MKKAVTLKRIAIVSIVAITIILIVQLWFVSTSGYARLTSEKNLRRIIGAIHNYLDSQKQFPEAFIKNKNGNPVLSWRVSILPYLGENKLYNQFDFNQPWDSPKNKELITRMPQVYSIPFQSGPDGFTHYRVFVGKGTAFEGKKLSLNDFSDGLNNTIFIVEAEEPVPWTKPDELQYYPSKPLPLFYNQSRYSSSTGSFIHTLYRDPYFNAVLGDGSILILPYPPENELKLRSMIIRNDNR